MSGDLPPGVTDSMMEAWYGLSDPQTMCCCGHTWDDHDEDKPHICSQKAECECEGFVEDTGDDYEE